MFRFGKKNGYLAIALLVLGVIPVLVAIFVVPQLPESIPTKFDAAGEVVRWGSRLDTLFVPVLCFLLSIATYVSGRRQATAQAVESEILAEQGFGRFMRNGLVTAVILNVANAYFMYTALTGTGLPF